MAKTLSLAGNGQSWKLMDVALTVARGQGGRGEEHGDAVVEEEHDAGQHRHGIRRQAGQLHDREGGPGVEVCVCNASQRNREAATVALHHHKGAWQKQ
jgi:hypothetical protein